MIIQRRLKYIKFTWDEDKQELTITTYPNPNDINFISSGALGVIDPKPDTLMQVDKVGDVMNINEQSITINKTYLFSTMRFMIRIAQRMWGRRKKPLDKRR